MNFTKNLPQLEEFIFIVKYYKNEFIKQELQYYLINKKDQSLSNNLHFISFLFENF